MWYRSGPHAVCPRWQSQKLPGQGGGAALETCRILGEGDKAASEVGRPSSRPGGAAPEIDRPLS